MGESDGDRAGGQTDGRNFAGTALKKMHAKCQRGRWRSDCARPRNEIRPGSGRNAYQDLTRKPARCRHRPTASRRTPCPTTTAKILSTPTTETFPASRRPQRRVNSARTGKAGIRTRLWKRPFRQAIPYLRSFRPRCRVGEWMVL